ncbi:hypothetical protein [bacterium endosymbiont of Pedicinus badii]|uniref:hypothetical protein n=1 Tax=bacterium endosymbiont of Pedicinus badii TaxID=1719126 RepID=UPI0011808672|nr:hypothetical protein [bacterium endosymbiont of Pedicinus badii]
MHFSNFFYFQSGGIVGFVLYNVIEKYFKNRFFLEISIYASLLLSILIYFRIFEKKIFNLLNKKKKQKCK